VKAARGDASSSTLGIEWRAANLPYFQRQNSGYGRIAYNDYESSDESDRDVGSSQSQQMAGSTLDNIDQWRFKLTMLLRNKEDQEVVSRERKDRRDFDHISALATRMGLHSRQYSKIVVISKAPLPNYRPDLDDKRPQREVVLPFGLQSEVDAHLHSFLDQKKTLIPEMPRQNSSESLANGYGNYETPETVMQNSLARERILRPRSLQLKSKQQQWVDSPEGQKMVGFRKTLPAYKEKDALLKAIAANQVVVVSGETGCGKTTQLPQYILESEIEAARGATCSIICTQPRRISAISVSERVAAERGEQIGESVSFTLCDQFL
jgi:ATP-dependent RNA helicase DHX36